MVNDDHVGWSYEVIKRIMSKEELKKFNKWIVGQTCPLGANGECEYYKYDVLRFLRWTREGVAPVWD